MSKFRLFNRIKLFTLFVFAIFISTLSVANRVGFADENWKTLRTEHFDIIFSAQQQNLGLYYAEVAETAYKNLATVFAKPVERLVLVVNDTTDIPNAYATVVPYPLVMAYPVQVGAHDSLSESGEWARELIVHEMTHIFQLEPANGLYRFLRPIFGSIIAPNLLTPLWWKEGMSVEMETRFSNQGRVRSVYQDTSYRAFVLANKLNSYTLADANEALPSFPYGSRPYLLGSSLWSEISKDTKEENVINHIVQRQSERVPYFINEPLLEANSLNYSEQYNNMLESLDKNAQAQLLTLRASEPSTLAFLGYCGHHSSLPVFSKAHNLFAFVTKLDIDSVVVVRDLSKPETDLDLKRLPIGDITSLDFHPTERKLLYSKVNELNAKYITSEIYEYNLETQKSEKITKAGRAREASYNQAGNQITFVSTFDGKTQINILDLSTKSVITLANSEYHTRYSSPLFWNEQTVLFVERDSKGVNSVYQIDIPTKIKQKLSLSFENIGFLKKSADKLFFNSSENGVRNIYVSEDLKTAKPLTHLLTGAWSYAIDDDSRSIWLSNLTSEGFQLAKTEFRTSSHPLPKIKNQIADRYKYQETSSVQISEAQKKDIEDYSSLGYLWPRYWIPFASSTNTGSGVYFQAQTSGHDPLGIHQYVISGNYRTDINRGGFSGAYLNSAFAVPFEIGSFLSSRPFGSLENVNETQNSYLSLKPDLFVVDKNLSASFGAQLLETNYYGNRTKHWGPFVQFAYLTYEQSIFQISPEKGWGAFLRYEDNRQLDDTDFDFQRGYVSLIGFANFGLLPRHHAVMGKISGITNFQNVTSRFGSSNATFFDQVNSPVPQFIMRGYIPAQFFGKTMWNANLEYRFPVHSIETGPAAKPIYFKRITGAIVADGLSTDGYAIKKDLISSQRMYSNDYFYSAGAEAKLDMTVGFVLPIKLVLGYYIPFQQEFADPTVGLYFEMALF